MERATAQRAQPREGAMRRWSFGPGGAGQVLYLVLDQQREVHVLRVLWVEIS